MGTITQTTEYWTSWKLPGTVKQYKESGQSSWIDLSDMQSDGTAHWAYCSSSAAINSSHASPKLYCYNFGFANDVPSNAEIKTIEVKIVCQDGSGYQGQIKDKLITLKTSDNVTNSGWASDYNYAPNTWSGNKSISTFIINKKADASGILSNQTHWGPSKVYASSVTNSNFGCVYQCVGTGSNYRRARIYNIQMRVQYAVTTTVTVTGNYNYSVSIAPSTINLGDSATVSVKAQNTNGVTDTPPKMYLTTPLGVFSNNKDNIDVSFPSIPANSSKTLTFTLITVGEGISQVLLFQKSNDTELGSTVYLVEDTTPPTYSATISCSSTLKVGENGTLKIVVSNTNNKAGTIEAISISPNDKIRINNTTSIQIPSTTLAAGGSKTYTYTVNAIATGQGTITIACNSFGTKTTNVNVAANENVQIAATIPEFVKDIAGDAIVDFTNSTSSSLTPGTVKYTLSSGFVFTSNNSNSLSQSLSEIGANSNISKTLSIKGNVVGGGTLTVEVPSTGKSQSFNLNCRNAATYTTLYSVSTDSCETGEQLTINCTITNTNSTAGNTPVTNISLPAGVTTLDGQSTYSFPTVQCSADGTISRTISVVTTSSGIKNIVLGGTNYAVTVTDPVVQAEPTFSSNWAYLTKTFLNPDQTSQLVVQYIVTNGSFPATIPQTSITILGDSVTFADDSISKTITPQTLNEGESFSNSSNGQLFLKFVKAGTSTVKLSNAVLGELELQIQAEYIGPIFTSTANVNPQIIEHNTDGSLVAISIRTVNSGDQDGKCVGSTISLHGDVLEFEDETNLKVLADRTISPGQENVESINVKTIEAGTGNINITNPDSNFNSSFQVIVEAPLVAEYDYSLNVVSPSIPVYGDEQVTTPVKITFQNNNAVAGDTPSNLVLYLSSGLSFADGTSSIEIPSQAVSSNGSVTYTVSKEVKGTSIGTYRIVLADSETNLEKASTTINIRGPTPTNKGYVNFENCKFIENKGSKGGAVCNYGKIFLKNVEYANNESTTKCDNTYDNGGCM